MTSGTTSEATSGIVERALGIRLPNIYRNLIDSPPSFLKTQELECYLWVSPETLVNENRAFVLDPADLSDIDDGSLVGGLKRRLFYGSKARIINHRRKYIEQWVESHRFQIGSDGGEETFFICLQDPGCAVWVFDLETRRVARRFESLASYVEHVKSVGKT